MKGRLPGVDQTLLLDGQVRRGEGPDHRGSEGVCVDPLSAASTQRE